MLGRPWHRVDGGLRLSDKLEAFLVLPMTSVGRQGGGGGGRGGEGCGQREGPGDGCGLQLSTKLEAFLLLTVRRRRYSASSLIVYKVDSFLFDFHRK